MGPNRKELKIIYDIRENFDLFIATFYDLVATIPIGRPAEYHRL